MLLNDVNVDSKGSNYIVGILLKANDEVDFGKVVQVIIEISLVCKLAPGVVEIRHPQILTLCGPHTKPCFQNVYIKNTKA